MSSKSNLFKSNVKIFKFFLLVDDDMKRMSITFNFDPIVIEELDKYVRKYALIKGHLVENLVRDFLKRENEKEDKEKEAAFRRH